MGKEEEGEMSSRLLPPGRALLVRSRLLGEENAAVGVAGDEEVPIHFFVYDSTFV